MSRPSATLIGQAIHPAALSKSILAAVTIGAGLVSLVVASQVRGAAAPMGQIRSTPVGDTIMSTRAENAHTALGPIEAHPGSRVIPDAGLRFGFLEFEDDPSASAERLVAPVQRAPEAALPDDNSQL